LYTLSNYIKENRYKEQYKEELASQYTQANDDFKNISKNDYLLFNIKELQNSNFESDVLPMKVVSTSNDSVVLGNILKIENGKPISQLRKNWSSDENYTDTKIDVVQYEKENGVKEVFAISKKELEKAININNVEESKFTGIQFLKTYPNYRCMLYRILHIEGPILTANYTHNTNQDGYYYEIENKGFDAHADSIISLKDDAKWQLSKEGNLKNGEKIALKTNNEGSAMLYCSDKEKNIYTFKLSNEDQKIEI
jgi:hypothetical protein